MTSSISTQKIWLSPIVAVTFIAVSITGILMLFHLKSAGIYPIHEWGGVIFVIVGIIHLILNWGRFVAYFKRRKAIWATFIGVLAMILIATAIPHGTGYHSGGKSTAVYGQITGNSH